MVLTAAIETAYAQLAACPAVREALAFLVADQARTLDDQRAITEIPAPPFQEQARGQYYRGRLGGLGLTGVTTDAEGNVFGAILGEVARPRLYVSAHLDTVFPPGTDTTVKEKDGRLYAPGIGDDARGLAALLSVIRALQVAGLRTVGETLWGGSVGEEGLGDLRGVKAFFRGHQEVDGFITVDGCQVNLITYLATGSRRYRITYRGPGGHSYGAFGLPSAIHALGRAIAAIAELQPPAQPKTTFTVGTVSGGTSVNSIAAEASLLLDLRSDGPQELRQLEEQALRLVAQAAADENRRWGRPAITVEIRLVGERPAGHQSPEAPIVQAAWAATRAVGEEPELSSPSSTDANVPISLGVPALRLGGGGSDGQNHSPGEWFDPARAYLGPQKLLLTVLGLAGVAGVSRPLLPLLR